jgi:hypothetical protein
VHFILVRLFIHSETWSRIFTGCQLLTSKRVDDWVPTYHSWEQPRCPHDGLQLKGSGIHATARHVTPRHLVQRQPTCPHALLSQSLKDPRLPYVTTLQNFSLTSIFVLHNFYICVTTTKGFGGRLGVTINGSSSHHPINV